MRLIYVMLVHQNGSFCAGSYPTGEGSVRMVRSYKAQGYKVAAFKIKDAESANCGLPQTLEEFQTEALLAQREDIFENDDLDYSPAPVADYLAEEAARLTYSPFAGLPSRRSWVRGPVREFILLADGKISA